MSDWQLNNESWVKSRKEEWKVIKPLIDKMDFLEKEDKPILKDWFLTGSKGDKRSITKVSAMPLFDLWLHPDKSGQRWQELRESDTYQEYQWANSVRRFDTYSKARRFINGTFFSGLEHRLYYFFHGKGLNRKKYQMPQKEYEEQIKRLAQGFWNDVVVFFEEEEVSPNDTIFCQLYEWQEAFVKYYQDGGELFEDSIELMEEVLADKASFDPVHVQFAERIEEIISDSNLPEDAKNRVAELREKYKVT